MYIIIHAILTPSLLHVIIIQLTSYIASANTGVPIKSKGSCYIIM